MNDRQEAPPAPPPDRPRWRLPRTFEALGVYNFRLFWFGQMISLTGTWMQTVAQAWLVLDMTHSPLDLGTVTALQFLPVLVLSLFAGVIVDRMSKRRLLVITQSVMMLQSLVLALLVATGEVRLWHVYALATALGLTAAFDTPARQAFVVEMVGREELVNAVALNSMLFNSARIVGPALGGVLIASIGIANCFFANTASFFAVLAGLLLMRPELLHTPPRQPRGRILRQMAEGLGYAVHTPAVFVIVLLMGVIGTFGYNFNTVLPLLARQALHVDAAGFGALVSVMGVGSLAAASLLATLRRASHRLLLAGAAAFGVILGAVALSRWYPLSLALMLPMGFAGITFTTTANSLLQLEVPDALRGRVMSLYVLLFLGSTPIGSLFTGTLAERVGIQWTVGVEAIICGLGAAAGFLYVRIACREPAEA